MWRIGNGRSQRYLRDPREQLFEQRIECHTRNSDVAFYPGTIGCQTGNEECRSEGRSLCIRSGNPRTVVAIGDHAGGQQRSRYVDTGGRSVAIWKHLQGDTIRGKTHSTFRY